VVSKTLENFKRKRKVQVQMMEGVLPLCGNCGSEIEDGEKRYEEKGILHHTFFTGCLRAMNKRLKDLETERRVNAGDK
jgi:hypothetical protein